MDPKKEAATMFKLMDLDGNGTLDPMEFASRLSDLGLGDAEIETLFLQMDKDSDGVISAEEFVSGFTKYKELEHRSLTTLAAAPSLVGSSRNAERYTEMQYESDTDLVDDLEKIMAAGDLHAEQQKAVDEAFAAADTDGSGSISEAEFGKVLAGLGVAMGGDELAHVLQAHFAKLDSDYSGELDLPEFGNFYRRCLATAELRRKYAKKARKHSLKLQKQEHEAHARRVFKQFDKDGTGAIEESELQTVVQQLLPDLTLKSEEWVDFAQSVLIAGDKDGNSALDFEEFFNFYMKCLVSDTAAEKYAAKVQMRYSDGKVSLVEEGGGVDGNGDAGGAAA